jgi:hypothetical protein
VARGYIGGMRMAASGTTVVAAGATATLVTAQRLDSELLQVFSFLDTARSGAGWGEGGPGAAATAFLSLWLERTATANEFSLQAANGDLVNARTVSWAVVAVGGTQ